MQRFQILVRVQRRHATRPGAGNGLPIDMILHIAGSEHTGQGGGGCVTLIAGFRDDVPIHHVELASKNIGIGLVADGDKATFEDEIAG